MSALDFDSPINPYHYILHCIGGKWKMTILHEIHTFGTIRFNRTLKVLPVSEKVLSQQLHELAEAGLIERISYDTTPPRVEYKLTDIGKKLIPALDLLYIWSVRRMDELGLPIDANAFVVHNAEKYLMQLDDVLDEAFLRCKDLSVRSLDGDMCYQKEKPSQPF